MLLPPLVLTLMLITLVGPVHASAASVASSGHASAPAHFTAPPKFIKGSTTQSTNWSGYAATGGSGAYTSVSGSWTEPTVTCSQTAYSSFWVGLDGYNSNTVEQTGTDSDCSGSTPCTGYLEHPFKIKHVEAEKDRHCLLANTGGWV